MAGVRMTGEPRSDRLSRRDLLAWIWRASGALALGTGGFIGLRFLSSRSDAGEAAVVVNAGQVDDFAPGTLTLFEHGRFYLLRADDGGFLALSSHCPHLGCTVLWNADEERFHCPCHGSRFTRVGDVLSPPAPRPLLCLPILIDESGQVQVDTATRIERASVAATDFTYAPGTAPASNS
ncbi:MAG: Rieske (2Fe-2S) protein [Anaerolineae bacterium]|nr:Rieske (2Fe-2S) protein [Anaerolineae bacterium]